MHSSVQSFLGKSDYFDTDVLRPLSHILPYWELSLDRTTQRYREEDGSYAAIVNALIAELQAVVPPAHYHDNEDRLAESVLKHLKWPIRKEGNRWVGADYSSIIEQGGFHDLNEHDLVLAVAGRIRAAIDRGQTCFDDMEESHRRMLAAVLSVILYHRTPPD
jgi:hypothetical protein